MEKRKQMEKRNNTVNHSHYALTFFSMVALTVCFGTSFITGNPAIIAMDSLAGSVLLGIVFCLYLCWFVYELSVSDKLSLRDAARSTLGSSSVAYCIYAYGIVFVFIPFVLNFF